MHYTSQPPVTATITWLSFACFLLTLPRHRLLSIFHRSPGLDHHLQMMPLHMPAASVRTRVCLARSRRCRRSKKRLLMRCLAAHRRLRIFLRKEVATCCALLQRCHGTLVDLMHCLWKRTSFCATLTAGHCVLVLHHLFRPHAAAMPRQVHTPGSCPVMNQYTNLRSWTSTWLIVPSLGHSAQMANSRKLLLLCSHWLRYSQWLLCGILPRLLSVETTTAVRQCAAQKEKQKIKTRSQGMSQKE